MFLRIMLMAVAFACWSPTLQAAPDCVAATDRRKGGEPIVDWYDNYIRSYRSMPGDTGAARPTKSQIEAFVDDLGTFNRRAVLDPLFFEVLVQQVMASYARAPDFKGIGTAAAEKIYKSSVGEKMDFSMLCISAKSLRSPDDAFAITLFGVVTDDCQHIGLRGLVFTATLVNGSTNGQCRPDQVFAKMFVLPLPGGTNEITFVCGKDQGGCARQ